MDIFDVNFGHQQVDGKIELGVVSVHQRGPRVERLIFVSVCYIIESSDGRKSLKTYVLQYMSSRPLGCLQ